MSKILRTLLVFLVSISIFSFSHKAFASAYITEDIITDTNWGISESPYLIQNSIVILPNTTLTLDPGVVVKFAPFTNSSIVVLGKFLAHGTENQKIYFTSGYDDEFYSNTDDEEFCYDEFDAEGNIIGGQVCEVYDLGEPFPGDWNGFYFDHSSNSVLQNVVFKYATDALFLYSSSVNFKNLNIEKSESGLTVFDHSVVDLLGGDLSDLDKDAISLFGNSSLTLQDVTVSNIHDDPISIFNTSTLNASNLTIQNLPQFDFPFTDVLALFNGSTLSIKNSDFTHCPGEACITFFNGSSYLTTPVDLSVEDTKFSGGTGSAFLTFGKGESVTNIKNSSIKNFANYGVENYSTITVNAENNDWGDPTGPKHSTLNPDGLGQALYGNVDFEPWVGQEAPVPDTFYAKIKDAPGGVAKMYMNANTSELVKTFPNDWILKVFGDTLTPDGWVKVQDMTDESYGWMNLVFEYEESKQGEFENVSSVQITTKAERASKIVEIVEHYMTDKNIKPSLYSGEDKISSVIIDGINQTISISSLVEKGFSVELLLAIVAQEIGDSNFDNENVSYDYGHGIMQLTMNALYREDYSVVDKEHPIRKEQFNAYLKNKDDSRGIYSKVFTVLCNNHKSVPIEDKNGNIRMIDQGSKDYYDCYKNAGLGKKTLKPYKHYKEELNNPVYKQYTNTLQSMYANIKDGLGLLAFSKYGQVFPFVDNSNNKKKIRKVCKEPVAIGKLVFSCNEIQIIKAVWGYNGASVTSDDYLGAISKKLKTLSTYFKDRSYSNTDQLIEKLAFAGKNRVELRKHSPIDITIKDSQNNIVGTVEGEEEIDLPNGYYDPFYERAVIFFPDDTYTYEVVGDNEGGTYGLDIDIFDDNEEPISFRAIDLPIIPREKHIYKVDQERLKNGEPDSVQVTIDKDGDGVPEYIIYSGAELRNLDPKKEVTAKPLQVNDGVVPLWALGGNIKPLVLGVQTEKTKEQLQNITPTKKTTTFKKSVKKPISVNKKVIAKEVKVETKQEVKEVNEIVSPIIKNPKKPNWFIRLWQLLF